LAQKRRTRADVVAAAAALVARGIVPTVAAAAEEAGVSRATAYRYFASQDQLLNEVATTPWSASVDRALAMAASAPVEERVDAVARTLHEVVSEHEGMFRAVLRSSLGDPASDTSGAIAAPRLRGGRRHRWLQEALAPARARLGEERFQRLAAALTVATGVEAVVVLRDICGIDSTEAGEVISWAVRALVRAELSDTSEG
jgi:AcrR family transcriptional regulator